MSCFRDLRDLRVKAFDLMVKIISSHAHKIMPRILIHVHEFLRVSVQYSQGLGKKTVCLSRTSTLSSGASNFLSSFAPRVRSQARHSPTKFLMTILKWVKFWKVFRWILTKIRHCNVVLLIVWHVFTVQKWLPSMGSKSAPIRVLPTTKSNRDQHKNAVYFLKFQLYFAGFQFHYKRTNSA